MEYQVFHKLPPIRGAREEPIDWSAVKQALIENEGEWVLMAENISNSTPQQLRTGKYKDFKEADLPHFEFAVRKPENPEVPYGPRKTDLYGKYTKKARS